MHSELFLSLFFAFVLQCCTAQLSLIIVGVSHWVTEPEGEAICNYVPLFTLRPTAKCQGGGVGGMGAGRRQLIFT